MNNKSRIELLRKGLSTYPNCKSYPVKAMIDDIKYDIVKDERSNIYRLTHKSDNPLSSEDMLNSLKNIKDIDDILFVDDNGRLYRYKYHYPSLTFNMVLLPFYSQELLLSDIIKKINADDNAKIVLKQSNDTAVGYVSSYQLDLTKRRLYLNTGYNPKSNEITYVSDLISLKKIYECIDVIVCDLNNHELGQIVDVKTSGDDVVLVYTNLNKKETNDMSENNQTCKCVNNSVNSKLTREWKQMVEENEKIEQGIREICSKVVESLMCPYKDIACKFKFVSRDDTHFNVNEEDTEDNFYVSLELKELNKYICSVRLLEELKLNTNCKKCAVFPFDATSAVFEFAF